MCVTTSRNYSILLVFIELFSGGLFLAGILVISSGRTEQCNSGCYEHSCLGSNYRYYECDCGSYCMTKGVVVDGVFRMAVAFIVLGVLGSIFGCILGCILRRRYYNNNPPPVIVANPVVYGIGTPVYQQQPAVVGMQPVKMEQYPQNQGQYPGNQGQYPQNQGQYPANQAVYGYGQPGAQNMAYGYPIQGPGFGDANQNQNTSEER